MDAFDFAELQGIDDQAGVSIASEPRTVIMIVRFVAKTDVVFFYFTMTANV